MDLNDKIAARRREIDEAKRKEVEAEQQRQRAELHRQQQAARMARQQEAEVKAQAKADVFKPATPIKTVDIDGETELINESIGLITKRQWALFLGLAFWALFNVYNADWIRVIVFAVLAIGYISYLIDKHRKTLVASKASPQQE